MRSLACALGFGMLTALVGCAATGVRTDELSDHPIAVSYRTPDESRRRAESLKDAEPDDPNDERAPEIEKIGSYIGEMFGAKREKPQFEGRLGLIDPKTGEVEIVHSAIRGAIPLDWSPDRRRLLFVHRVGQQLQLMEFDRKNESLRTLTRGPDAHPRGCYGPEGRLVLLAVNPRTIKTRILMTDRMGGNPKQVSRLDVVHSPTCAPDGSSFAYVSVMPDGAQRIISHVPALDGAPRAIAPGREPRYSADGQWIVFAAPSRKKDEWKLWRIRPSGTGRAPLGKGLFTELRPSFSPDGRVVVYVIESGYRPWLYLRRFDGTGDRLFFRNGDADHPVW